MSALPIGILASGTGTNFDAIARAISEGRLAADIRVVICNRPGAKVLASAQQLGIATESLDHKRYDSREVFDRDVVSRLTRHGVELVVMAGFDRIVTPVLLDAFPDRVINIHPALLPAFKGLDAQTQAAEYGVRITGATVHLVDGDLDHGPIIVQAAVPIAPGESAEAVRLRILAQEHRIYPYAISLFAENRIRLHGRQVYIDGDDAGHADREVLVSPSIHRASR